MAEEKNNAIKNYKRKLALIFTSILIITVFMFQTIYTSIGAYNNFLNSSRMLTQVSNVIGRGGMPSRMMGKSMSMKMPKDDDSQGPNFDRKPFNPRVEHIVFDKDTGLLFSTTISDFYEQNINLNSFAFKDAIEGKIQEIKYEDEDYLIYKSSFILNNKNYVSYVMMNNVYSTSKILTDLFLFMIFAIFLGVIIYYFIYKLIDMNLRTVESNLKDMESFIHNAGHELKTPLTIASSSLQLAIIDKKNTEYIKQAQESIKKMDGLIESLLDLSSLQKNLENEDVRILECIDEVAEYYANDINAKNITLSKNINFDKKIQANKQHIYILISNLVNNAIKYNNQGGSINVILNKNSLEVKDTGQGIPAKEISKIFDRFYQVGGVRNQNGYGIGLSLVKKICDLYGWKIEVNSVEGEGTAFNICM